MKLASCNPTRRRRSGALSRPGDPSRTGWRPVGHVLAAMVLVLCHAVRSEEPPGDRQPAEPTERQRLEQDERRERLERATRPDRFQTMLQELLQHFPPERREDLSAFLKQNFTDELNELRELARGHIEAARVELPHLIERVNDLFMLAQNNPDAFATHRRLRELERASERLGREYRESEGERRDAIAATLRDTVQEAFELKQEILRNEAEAVAREARELAQRHVHREELREEIVERRIEQVTGKNDPLEW